MLRKTKSFILIPLIIVATALYSVPNKIDHELRTFSELLEKKDIEKIKRFIELNPKLVNAENSFGETTLQLAAESSTPEVVEFLLKRGASIEGLGARGAPALIWAIKKKNLLTIKTLLTNGANPNAQDFDGVSPLHAAVYADYPDILDLLIQNGAVCLPDKSQRTPLFIVQFVENKNKREKFTKILFKLPSCK